MVATMHRLAAAMLVLLCCCCCQCLFLATHAHPQAQLQPAAGGNRASPSCIPHERDALLAFKHGVTSYPAGVLSSWRRDGSHDEQDCCQWRGVRCSNRTGHVHELRLRGNSQADLIGQISHSLLALDHLEHLDLSYNQLEGPTGRIPEFLGSLKNLKHLNLSNIPFYGCVPPQLGNLSRLQSLDLSSMGGGTYMNDLSWLTRLPSIQYLNLNQVNLNTVVDWAHVMNMLPSLRVLHVSYCSLASANQSLPHLNLTNLEELDASYNSFDHPMVTSWFWNITSLRYLYLDYTGLYGQFPDALGDMASLRVLDLSSNTNYDDEKYRIMTTALKNLCNLEVLNLGWTLLYGDVAELFKNKLPRCSPDKLQELDLSGNKLTGMLPRWIGQLTSLVVLNLGFNNITGSLPPSVGLLTSLQTLDLSRNNLNGHVPYEIGKLGNLTHLDLSRNKLDGMITEEHFVSARSLKYIDLSYNALKIDLRSDWKPPSQLNIVNFASCRMGPLFPGWLQWNVTISYLDISCASIADRLPPWFDNAFSNIKFLNMSNNQLNGTLPTDMGSMSLQELYLSSNQYTGQIPILLPPNILMLDLSNNLLSGPLPSVTTSTNLSLLSLFSNQITGHVPQSFCKFQELNELDLSNNFLVGEVPSCLGVMEKLEFLALSNNSLSGEFPSFVQNFTNMLVLDLSRNQFSGGLPMWIGKLTSIIILRLSHNKFRENIPANITNLGCLQYMDLHNNKISGSLPSYFSNLQAMRKTDKKVLCDVEDINNQYPIWNNDPDPFHLSSLSMVLKGRELNYGSIDRVMRTSMMSIDLSCNNLVGEIPEEIVLLDGLVNLNMSWNHLSGVIPNKIGEMESLESLDLSRNMLSGEIPAALSNLTFLSDLDLSYNNLTGKIPSGGQLDTLYAEYPSMYVGNTGLYGCPLPNKCSNKGDTPNEGGLGTTDKVHGIQFFYLGLWCGFVVGTWMAFGVLLFKRSWRIACFRLSDKLCDKVFVLVVVWARKTGTDHHA